MKEKTTTLRGRYSHVGYALIFVLYLLVYILAESLITGEDAYWATQIPALDALIPFCEWFVIPYVLWYPAMAVLAVYLIFRDPDGFRKYAGFLGTSMLVAILFCLVVPNGQDLRPAAFERDNLLTQLVGSLYATDTNTNVIPSTHVVGSIGIAFGVFTCDSLRSKWVRVPTLLFVTAVCLATVFIKQHAVLDLLVALPYSALFYVIWYVWYPKWLARRRERKNA